MFAPERGSVVRDWIHIQMATQQPTATPLLPLMHLSPMINDQMLLPSPSMILAAGVERGVELIWVGRVWGSDNFNLSAAKQCVMSPLFLVEVHRLDQYSQRRERGGGVRRGDGLASF